MLYFATGNKNKVIEAQEILNTPVKQFLFNHREIRSDSVEEVAFDSVKAAYEELGKPVFVEDSGLFIDVLNGFPGTYSKWVYNKIGNSGILNLLKGVEKEKRTACFKCAIAFTDGQITKTFLGVVNGYILEEPMGNAGFGYDPIFVPEGFNKSFAQSIQLKNKLSHRYKALNKLDRFLSDYYGKVAFKKEG